MSLRGTEILARDHPLSNLAPKRKFQISDREIMTLNGCSCLNLTATSPRRSLPLRSPNSGNRLISNNNYTPVLIPDAQTAFRESNKENFDLRTPGKSHTKAASKGTPKQNYSQPQQTQSPQSQPNQAKSEKGIRAREPSSFKATGNSSKQDRGGRPGSAGGSGRAGDGERAEGKSPARVEIENSLGSLQKVADLPKSKSDMGQVVTKSKETSDASTGKLR